MALLTALLTVFLMALLMTVGMRKKICTHFIGFSLLLAVGLTVANPENLEKARNQHQQTLNAGIKSQQKVDKVDDETQSLSAEIKTRQHQLQTLKKYNQRMAKLVDHQQQELVRLENETRRVTHLDREILPLVEDMLANLDEFVTSDQPFLPLERSERMSKLKNMLDRADVTVAEKFRRVLEAYQIENDYGRTLEAYTGQLSEGGNDRVVNFLRVGRNLLFYKSQNGNEIARWDNKHKSWVTMDKKFHREIKKAYLIAKNQRAPELLLLPMPALEQRVEVAE